MVNRRRKFIPPYDDIHDQEVPHQANDADDHVDDHDGNLHACRQHGGVVVGTAEVVLEKRVIVELQLSQQEVLREVHV